MNEYNTPFSEHEHVIMWNESGNLPAAWKDVHRDGKWQHAEEMTVMNTTFEREND